MNQQRSLIDVCLAGKWEDDKDGPKPKRAGLCTFVMQQVLSIPNTSTLPSTAFFNCIIDSILTARVYEKKNEWVNSVVHITTSLLHVLG